MKSTRWRAEVGRPPLVVHIEERPGRPTLWLRWWDRTKRNWRWEPTAVRIRDERGRIIRSAEAEAMAMAEGKRRELAGGAPPVLAGEHLSLLDGLAEVIHPDTGLYPVDTPHRREVVRAVQFAARVLADADPPCTTWIAIGPQQVQQVWRRRIRELAARGDIGHRSAEIVTSRLLTAAAWLKSNRRIPAEACLPPHKWRPALRTDWRQLRGETRDPLPHRPRYTGAESLALLAVAPQVDPRFHLLLWLGMELRLGQVARARRRDLDLAARTFEVHGLGHKRGTTVHLTDGQLDVATHALTLGYLAPLEQEGGDFPLFPNGQLAGGRKGIAPHCRPEHRHAAPVGSTARRNWLHDAEELAKVSHLPGRGLVGFRRAAVDAAMEADGLDPDALQKFGGWEDPQVPLMVYRNRRETEAEHRATAVRARIRGETVANSVATSTGAESGEVAK